MASQAIIAPKNDTRSYHFVQLDNGLRAVLIHDADAENYAAAMSVGVGSMSDPADIPGLAHFLEHMLFLGTKNHPEESHFAERVSKSGGSSNAYTADEETVYYFELRDQFWEVLQIWSEFFTCPLLSESAADRELNAVNQEHEKNRHSDPWRESQLLRRLANAESAFNHFGTGTLATLRDEPLAKGISVREALLDFHDRWYVAGNMSLAILSCEPVDVIEARVRALFADVRTAPVRGVAAPAAAAAERAAAFTTDVNLPLYVTVLPVNQKRHLNLVWPVFPPDIPDYRSRCSSYLGHLLGHEGPGSILDVLKTRGWANELMAGVSIDDTQLAVFSVRLELTADGYAHTDDIAELVFGYVGLLAAAPAAQHGQLYEEYRDLQRMMFDYSDPQSAVSVCQALATSMAHGYPVDELLLSRSVPQSSFDVAWPGIEARLALLRQPGNVIVRLISNQIDAADCPLLLPHYDAHYGCTPLPPALRQRLQRAVEQPPSDSGLQLPPLNPFVPRQFTVLAVDDSDAASPSSKAVDPAPQLLIDTASMQLWHVADRQFRQPKCAVLLEVQTSALYMSPAHSLSGFLFITLINDLLNSYAYDALVAGLQYEVAVTGYGFFIGISGFADKLDVLLFDILAAVEQRRRHYDQHFAKRFADVKDSLRLRYLAAAIGDPRSLVARSRLLVLGDKRFTLDDDIATLESLTLPFVLDLVDSHLLPAISLAKLFVHGNASADQAAELGRRVDATLQAIKHSAGAAVPLCVDNARFLLQRRSPQFPAGVELVHAASSRNAKERSSAAQVSFQIGWDNPRDVALLELFAQIVSTPIYDQLRTQQQLGYIVWSGPSRVLGVLYFAVLVQSATATPDQLETAIDASLADLGALIDALTDDDFAQHRSSLRSVKAAPNTQAKEITERFWLEISSTCFMRFNYRFVVASLVDSLTKDDLLAFYRAHIAPTAPRKKLVVAQWPYGADLPTYKSDRRLSINENLLAWQSSRPLYPVPSPSSAQN